MDIKICIFDRRNQEEKENFLNSKSPKKLDGKNTGFYVAFIVIITSYISSIIINLKVLKW